MPYAEIDWTDDKIPRANQFGDIYFSVENGLAESTHVFVNQNFLPERFKALKEDATQRHFVIAETGFGSGLNFVSAYIAWTEAGLADSCHRLTFISTEKFPLSPDDFARFSTLWPEQQAIYNKLQCAYPALLNGQQTLLIDENVKINLLIGDASSTLADIDLTVDAWFLDGFAPSKNPDMWSDALFSEIARLSQPGTTYATFTSARVVKDALKGAGFQVRKCKGYGRKREMCYGEILLDLEQTEHVPLISTQCEKPWHVRPSKTLLDKTAIVVGAGLAGAHTAYNLANRGWRVTVIESNEAPANGASGNKQGVIYTKPSSHGSKEDDFYMQCFQFAIQHYQHLSERFELTGIESLWRQDGLLQLAYSDKDRVRLKSAYEHLKDSNLVEWLTAEQASELSGVKLHYPALWFKSSGWVQPRLTTMTLLEHPLITLATDKHLNELTQESSGGWVASCKNKNNSVIEYTAAICVLTNAWQAKDIHQAKHLNLRPVRGQVSSIPANKLAHNLKTAICSDSYVTPALHNELNFGASFYNDQTSTEVTDKDHQDNLNKLQAISDDLKPEASISISGRAAVRCITNDRLPVVGPLNNHDFMVSYYGMLKRDKNWQFSEPESAQFYSGLYCNLGFASKGLTTIPLCTEYLCNLIEGKLLNFDLTLRESLSSSRFTIKPLIKGKI